MHRWSVVRTHALLAATVLGVVAAVVAVTPADASHGPGEPLVIEVTSVNDMAGLGEAGVACPAVPGGGCTLRAAIQLANAEDGPVRITVPAGDFNITTVHDGDHESDGAGGDLNIVRSGPPGAGAPPNPIEIVGAGLDETVIRANGNDRVFEVLAGAELTLRSLTITGGDASRLNGTADEGGGIWADGAHRLTLDDVRVTGNSAATGAGIMVVDTGEVNILRSVIDANVATSDLPGVMTAGGGLAAGSGVDLLQIEDTTIHDNEAFDGGGLHLLPGHSTGDRGGAARVMRTLVEGNSAERFGGGLYAGPRSDGFSGGFLVMTSTLHGNHAAIAGGGLYLENPEGGDLSASGDLRGSTVTDNEAPLGGALHAAVSPFHIGGGDAGARIGIVSSIVLDNDGVGPDCATTAGGQISSGDALTTGFNLGSAGPGGSFETCGMSAATDDLATDDARLLALGGHGGPTLVRMPYADSPARAGVPAGASLCIDGSFGLDQRGVPRLVDDQPCDIGAVQRDVAGPIADAGGPYTVESGATIDLDGRGSSHPAGLDMILEWDLDADGTFDDATGVDPTFDATGLSPGTYTVGLRITDAHGATDDAIAEVTVLAAPDSPDSPDAPDARDGPRVGSGEGSGDGGDDADGGDGDGSGDDADDDAPAAAVPVPGDTADASVQLPRTGTATSTLLMTALLALLAGTALLRRDGRSAAAERRGASGTQPPRS